MIIASAQSVPKDGNIEANLDDHYRLARLAADNGASLVVFPEMSLTGYIREQALEQCFIKDDTRLNKLLTLAVEKNIIIVAGAPINIDSNLHIASIILLPGNTISIYTKQFLHSGEEISFNPHFGFNPTLSLNGETLSFAICADITHPIHPANASQRNTSLYIASIYYTPGGITEGYDRLSDYARSYSMNVLMSNFGGPSYKFEAGGSSAFWASGGERIGKLKDQGEGLLLVESKNEQWICKEIYTN